MEIRHFKLIVAVAKLGSLTKASDELFLSQPALSHQLREVEEELGVKVFKRVNNRMVLTEIGEVIKAHSQESLKAVASLYDSLKRVENSQAGKIRISLQHYNAYHWMGHIIEKFQEQFPQTELEIVTDRDGEILERLREGKLDLAIMHTCLYEKELDIQKLFSDEIVLVVNKKHHLSNQSHVSLLDLEDETLILNTLTSNYEPLVDRFFNIESIGFRKVMYMNLTDTTIQMVKAGLGVSILPKWLVCPKSNPDLICLPFSDASLIQNWYLVHKVDPAISRFKAFVKELSCNLIAYNTQQKLVLI